MRHVVGSVIARRDGGDDAVGRELQQLVASVVDVRDVLLHALNDDAHGALAGLLAGRDVHVVSAHELVDGVAIDVDFRVVEDERDREISL